MIFFCPRFWTLFILLQINTLRLCYVTHRSKKRLILTVYQFLHPYREASALANQLPEESDQFRFFHSTFLVNLKGSVGLILTKSSDMRISTMIPLHLSSRSFIPLPCFIRSRRPIQLLVPFLVLFPPCSS